MACATAQLIRKERAVDHEWDAMSAHAMTGFASLFEKARADVLDATDISWAVTNLGAENAVLMGIMRQMARRIAELEEALTKP
jgi:hypothetical protein